jgi:hypothetical protein
MARIQCMTVIAERHGAASRALDAVNGVWRLMLFIRLIGLKRR